MLSAERTNSRYAVEIPHERFIALMDSESHATDNAAFKDGNETLCAILERETMALDVEYNGHFGNFVFYTIEAEDDNHQQQSLILLEIDQHLSWCETLEITETVRKRRAQAA